MFLTETNTKNIFAIVEELQPQLVIVDSIQTLYSPVARFGLRKCGPGTSVCRRAHEVCQRNKHLRISCRSHHKRRQCSPDRKYWSTWWTPFFNSKAIVTSLIEYFELRKTVSALLQRLVSMKMLGSGLREVSNPSEILISQKDGQLSGATIGATIEGNRPLLIEIQSLVSPASYGTPQRTSTGFDQKRLNMLLAVLEKRSGFKLSTQDVFLNMAGGISVEDPAIDWRSAPLSSHRSKRSLSATRSVLPQRWDLVVNCVR